MILCNCMKNQHKIKDHRFKDVNLSDRAIQVILAQSTDWRRMPIEIALNSQFLSKRENVDILVEYIGQQEEP